MFLLRPGLPDPAMSYLPLGNTVGACSEMIQQAVNSYIEKNPHGVITAEESPTAIHAYEMNFYASKTVIYSERVISYNFIVGNH